MPPEHAVGWIFVAIFLIILLLVLFKVLAI
jgi:hypothetical protein